MNTISKAAGLSARRRIITFRKPFWMLAILLGTVLTSCENSNGQSKDSRKNQLKNSNEPKVDIKVNRHYDDKGNMIGYDSTYSSYYSNIEGDTSRMRSLMNNFDFYFKDTHPSFFDKQFNKLFFSDTIKIPSFFRNDFFLKRYESSDRFFKDMMHQLDSIKNRFYREKHEWKNKL